MGHLNRYLAEGRPPGRAQPIWGMGQRRARYLEKRSNAQYIHLFYR